MLPDAIPIAEMLGMRYVPISFRVEENQRHVEVPGVMEMNVEGLEGIPGQVMQIANVGHPANSTLSLARGTKATYKDYDFNWDNTGRNGHYATFQWSGP